MTNQVWKYILAVVLGVAIAVPIAMRATTKPVLVRQLGEIADTQRTIEQRLANIEKKQGFIHDVLRQVGEAPQAAQRQAPPPPPPENFDTKYEIPVAHSPIKGKQDAPVTIVEFVDFQCPFCRRFHPPVNQVLEEYPDKVNYVIKHFPLSFHPQARSAAKAALAAGEQGKFYEMADLLLENNQRLSEATFKELAGQLGLDVDRFTTDYRDKDDLWEKIINEDMTLAAQVNVRGTPTFYLNGKKTSAREFETWQAEIEAILEGKEGN